MLRYEITTHERLHRNEAHTQLHAARRMVKQAKRLIEHEIEHAGAATWSRVTSWFELSKYVVRRCRGTRNIPGDASNAFFKAVELAEIVLPAFAIDSSDSDDDNDIRRPLRLFDNASLPGDFIRAFSVCLGPDRELDWRANSLYPDGLDDRFGLLRDNPDRWMMTDKMNGDVTRSKNIKMIAHILAHDTISGRSWRPDIYTSDLGCGARDYYNEELEHLCAHTGQIALGLAILRDGGTMIVKSFTIFETATVSLVELLTLVFDSVEIVKPETSKADNGECYIVAEGYTPDDNIVGLLLDKLDDFDERPVAAPKYFTSVVSAAVGLARSQSAKIAHNVHLFENHLREDYTREAAHWSRVHL